MKKSLSIITLLFAALIASSCAHTSPTEQKIDKEIKGVNPTQTKAISATVKEMIATSNLTPEQKSKLAAIEEKSHAKHAAITDEIERTKVVLIQLILSPEMSQKEFKIVKNKLIKLDKERMDSGFATAVEVRNIIAPKATVQDREVYKAVIENRLKGF
jgi:Spy/CpxP family protein refolding chaperone